MTHNVTSYCCEIGKITIYKMEIYRIEQKMLAVGTASSLFEYLCNELKYFKEKLEREEQFCELLINEINKEYENGSIRK